MPYIFVFVLADVYKEVCVFECVPWFIPILFQIWTLLTGQDVMLCGFAGALAGALTCGSVILNRNLHLDAIGLAKRVKNGNNKKKD